MSDYAWSHSITIEVNISKIFTEKEIVFFFDKGLTEKEIYQQENFMLLLSNLMIISGFG